MGDMADDAYDADRATQSLFSDAADYLREQGCPCVDQALTLNEDGLVECLGCGRTTDV